VEDFGTIMAENSEFKPTTSKSERFLRMTSTLFCDELPIERFKPFV
jgi:hypothetical protein